MGDHEPEAVDLFFEMLLIIDHRHCDEGGAGDLGDHRGVCDIGHDLLEAVEGEGGDEDVGVHDVGAVGDDFECLSGLIVGLLRFSI